MEPISLGNCATCIIDGCLSELDMVSLINNTLTRILINRFSWGILIAFIIKLGLNNIEWKRGKSFWSRTINIALITIILGFIFGLIYLTW